VPRKLKAYTTSAGFFDLAVAAPSIKAAVDAWVSKNNLFHRGFAKVSSDPEVVEETKPGVFCAALWAGARRSLNTLPFRNFANVVERPAKRPIPPAQPDDQPAAGPDR
jgi:hypothetical protein